MHVVIAWLGGFFIGYALRGYVTSRVLKSPSVVVGDADQQDDDHDPIVGY